MASRKVAAVGVLLAAVLLAAAIIERHKPLIWGVERSSVATLVLWPAEPLERVFKDSQPARVGERLRLSCVRNEYEGCMFGLRSNADVKGVRLEVSELRSASGVSIPASCAKAFFVGSIPLSRNTPLTPIEELERSAPYEVPDPLLDVEEVDLKAGVTQPCYYRVYVPPGAEPGEYRGFVRAVAADGSSAEMEVVVTVHPVTLPGRRSLYVTNWFSLDNIAKACGAELWSEGFWRCFEKWVAMMSEYRQNVFWVPLDTVKVAKRGGSYEFDFSVFDRYVEILLKHRADLIEITHVAGFTQWGGSEIRLRSFKVAREDGSVAEEPGEAVLPHLLRALEEHLRERGWLERTVIHIADEPTEDGIEEWRRVSRFVREHAPSLRRIDAVETTGFGGDLEIWVPTLHHYDQWMEEYERARGEGAELWFYTCLNPVGRYPNRFLDYPLTKTRVLHWINYAYGLRGFLHWGFNWWWKDPFGEPNPNLPPGDTHIAYPGKGGRPLPSLRLEAMRDGLEDYELLKLLEEEIAKVKRELGGRALELPFERRALELCRRVVPSVTGYARKPEELLAVREQLVREILELRERPLALALTEPPEWEELEWGPVMVLVRGACEEGCEVEVNGKRVPVRGGYFATYTGLDQAAGVVVKVKKGEAVKVIERRFTVRG
jgi:hypothetical protein